MAQIERQQTVLNILQNLRDLDGLKKLFWEELNYERENKPLSPRQWPDSAKQALAEDPLLFAGGGEQNAFHVVYCRMASPDLRRGFQRPVVNQLLRDHPYALFVFSNESQSAWHFLNVKYDETPEKRRLIRRITVLPGEGLRTATERLQMLDLKPDKQHDFTNIPPLKIQELCDLAFDVEKVTREFYREIANWYFWALKYVEFPKDAPKEVDGHDHISVIRLITRLIFCWFIREKGLISDVLFDARKLAGMLDGFAPDKSRNKDSVFYRAILQNLFFATLNTEMGQRGWRREDQNFMAHTLYRHKECFRDPKTALEWFKNIPFLNGGLFECLDKDLGEGAKPRYVRIDGFSDRPDSQPVVPDILFFGPEQEMDLSEDYGDKKFRKVRVRGLIDTLNRYKFTIEENTPFDQEVALDPELCGKVFENLLAAFNPETGTTARKATGSFYTPREIVDYMVDEALAAYLKEKLTTENNEHFEKKVRSLFAYDDIPHEFTKAEVDHLLDAIDNLKALDPAVGSGAFPMGMLHKLVHILGKLDPDNEKWKAKQIAKLDDSVMREEAERVFRDNYDNYGRKLFLIENCIYGVDIQPIAVQIAKMRFFVSLIVDQKVNLDAPNLGVRALPNLETKFVAANTLIGIERPTQMLLRNPAIDAKEAELRRVRDKHFTAKTLTSKARCREQDKKLRDEIAALLKNDGWDDKTAKQLAAWDPYNQNASADFFNPEWMFGITGGFNIVVGNPPYRGGREWKEEEGNYYNYFVQNYVVAEYQFDIYALFWEQGIRLASDNGIIAFITPNTWLNNQSATKLRKFILETTAIVSILDCSRENVFTSTVVLPIVTILRKGTSIKEGVKILKPGSDAFIITNRIGQGLWEVDDLKIFNIFLRQEDICVRHKIERDSIALEKLALVKFGIKLYETGKGIPPQKASDAKNRIFEANTKLRSDYRKYLEGKDVDRYEIRWQKRWLRYGDNLAAPRDPTLFVGNRLLFRRIVGERLIGTFTDEDFVTSQLLQIVKPFDGNGNHAKVLLAMLNSALMAYYFKKKYNRQDKTFPEIRIYELAALPMPKLVIPSAAKRLIGLVEEIAQAKDRDADGKVASLEYEIDQQVYALYGLTPEEIKIVESSAK